MKIRSGFVSNSSSSSFILPKGINTEEVKQYIKDLFNQKIRERKEEIKSHYSEYLLSEYKKQYLTMLEDDLKRLDRNFTEENIDKNIIIEKVKDIYWDLSEWFDNLDPDDLVLYDEDSNYLNWVGEEIVEKFNIEQYCLHMG